MKGVTWTLCSDENLGIVGCMEKSPGLLVHLASELELGGLELGARW